MEEQSGLAPDEQFVWLDVCSVNQHDVESKPAEWYSTTFHEAIRRIGFTCLVLTPVMSPTPLKRSWCLWELFGTIHTNTRLKICVPSSQQTILVDLMQRDFLQIMRNICSVDAGKAEAFLASDRDRIREAIDRSVGIERINQAALDPLRQWLLETASSAVAVKRDAELFRGLGVLRVDLGKIDLAIQAFEECLQMRRDQLEKVQDPSKQREIQLSIAGDLTNLGVCKFQKGQSNEALNLYSESLDLRIRLGSSLDLPLAYNNKALALKSLRRYKEAFECFDMCLEIAIKDGDSQAEENTQMNRAELLRETGDASKAAVVLRDVLASKIKANGLEHVSVAQVRNLLGQSLLDLGEWTEAEAMFAESLRIRSRVLGEFHPSVGLCVSNLAKLDTIRGDTDKAKKRYQELIRLQTEAFGGDHPFVKETERRMLEETTIAEAPRINIRKIGEDPRMLTNVYMGMALPQVVSSPNDEPPPFMFNQAYSGMAVPSSNNRPTMARVGRETSAVMMIPPAMQMDDEDDRESSAGEVISDVGPVNQSKKSISSGPETDMKGKDNGHTSSVVKLNESKPKPMSTTIQTKKDAAKARRRRVLLCTIV